MKHQITFGFGAGEDASGRQLLPSEVAIGIQRIRQHAAELFGGYTITQTQGGWVNPAGRLVEEAGFTLSILVTNRDDQLIKDMAKAIKEALRQEAVVVIIAPIEWEVA